MARFGIFDELLVGNLGGFA